MRLHVHTHRFSAFAVLLASAPASLLSASERHYAIFDIGSLRPGSPGDTTVYGMNERATIVGGSDVGTPQRPFAWSGGTMIELPTLGGDWGRGLAVNEHDTVVGWSTDFGTSMDPHVATIWTDGAIFELGSFGGAESEARDINDDGIAVGSAQSEGPTWQVARWVDGRIEEVAISPDARYSSAGFAINNDGWIAGNRWDIDRERHLAVLWRDGEEIDLGTLGGDESAAYAVNDLGQIAGAADRPGFDDRAMFLWEDGIMRDLGGIAGFSTLGPWAINNLGEIVGATFEEDTFNARAFYWAEDSGPAIVQDLLPPDSGITVEFAGDINDRGQFVGWGYTDDRFRAQGFLVSPVTPTMTLAPADGARIVAGANNELLVTDAPANATVYLLWSNRGGGTEIPGCALIDNAVQLAKPRTFATVTTDASGSATYVGFVPADAAGKTILLQAVAPETCAISTLRVETVQ